MSDEYCAVRFPDGKYLVCSHGEHGIEWVKGEREDAYVQSRSFLEACFMTNLSYEIVNI